MKKGFILRSGAAEGADKAFEKGYCQSKNWKDNYANKEIYLPWRGFGGSPSPYFDPPTECFELAGSIHPAWERLSQGAKRLHARNTQQVLGLKLDTPADLVVCWTPGGTRTAIVLAKQRGIRVINLGKDLID